MGPELSSPSATSRTTQACEACRVKRVRCSGDVPCCRCRQQHEDCVYGYSRGQRRASILLAIDQHKSSLAITVPTSCSSAASRTLHLPTDQSPSPYPITPASTMIQKLSPEENPPGEPDGHISADDMTDSSLASPLTSVARPPKAKTKSRTNSKSKSDPRKNRISSACLECKKRRRKCTGEIPCQTCVDFQTECIYDPSGDRRSKAYFNKRLAEGLRDAAQADSVLSLQKNGSVELAGPDDIERALQAATPSQPTLQRHGSMTVEPLTCNTFCALSPSGSPKADWYDTDLQDQQESRLRGPIHVILPHIVQDTSPLSMAFVNFRNGVVEMFHQGTPLDWLLGPLDTAVDLVFRQRDATDPFSCSTWASEVARIMSSHDVFTQLAHAFLLARYMRWVVFPTLENFLLLPDIMRPTPASRCVPHYASADLYPFAAIRDSLVRGSLDLDGVIGAEGTTGIRFYWPFTVEQAIDTDPVTGTITVSRLFTACASDLRNWSCGRDFLEGALARNLVNVIAHRHTWEELPEALS